MLFDAAELLTTIKNRGMVPANAGSWSDAELLKAASEEISAHHLPLLINAKGEYLVKEQVIPLVAGQESYLLSYRAAAVRNLSLKFSDGREAPITELSPPKQANVGLNRTTRGTPLFYKFREGYIDLTPLPADASASILAKWHIKPSRLVVVTECRQVLTKFADNPSPGYTRIQLGTDASVATAPTSFASALGGHFDFVGFRNPFSIKGWDVSKQSLITAGVSTTIDFLTADLPTDLVAGAEGDWITVSQKTPVPNIPDELHVAAALRAAAAAVGSRNDDLRNMLLAEAGAKEVSLLNGILAPRNKGAPKRLVQRRW